MILVSSDFQELNPALAIILQAWSGPGPAAFAIAGIVATSAALIFGGELNAFVRRLLTLSVCVFFVILAGGVLTASPMLAAATLIAPVAVVGVSALVLAFWQSHHPAATPAPGARSMPPLPAPGARSMPPVSAPPAKRQLRPPMARPVKRKRREKAPPSLPAAPAPAVSPSEGLTDPLPEAPHVDDAALFQLFPAGSPSDIWTWTGQDDDDAPDHDAQIADEWLRKHPTPHKKH